MRKLKEEEIKKIQLGILDEIVLCCKKYKINYWLDSGTLLGAVRHKGYIPWDDDIDIGMLREDYENFMVLFNQYAREENKKYLHFESIETKSDFIFPYGKVFDNRTVLYEPGLKMAINVDVFIYDNVLDDDDIVSQMYFWRDFYSRLNRWQRKIDLVHACKIKKGAITILSPILRLFPIGFFCKRVILNSKRYADQKCLYVGNFTAATRIKSAKKLVEKCVEMSFEGKMYNVPIGYDEWLKNFYGDYMKLPPKSEQIPKHGIQAYVINKYDGAI